MKMDGHGQKEQGIGMRLYDIMKQCYFPQNAYSEGLAGEMKLVPGKVIYKIIKTKMTLDISNLMYFF